MNTFVFFDDFMLWKYAGIARRVFHPRPVPEATLTGRKMTGGTLLWCPEADRYRLWHSTIPDIAEDWRRFHTFLESEDGLHWHAPEAGEAAAKDAPSIEIMRDALDPDTDRLYKCTYIDFENRNDVHGSVAFSRDAVRWRREPASRFCSHNSDTKNCLFYNAVTGEYQMIHRANFMDRRICCARSRDLRLWSRPELLLSPDPFDPPGSEYYGMAVHPQEGYFLGFLSVFHTDMDDPAAAKMAGKVDSLLVYSYDGRVWSKADARPLVERPMPPEFGSCCLYLHSLVPTRDGGSWILQASGTNIDHACGFTPAYPGSKLPEAAERDGYFANLFYTIRREGFVGMEAHGFSAHLVLKPMDLMGGELYFNLCAPRGRVEFQISESPGRPIPGFSFSDSTAFTGDEVRHKPAWKNGDLAILRGRKVTLELQMYSAVLFSLSGDLRPHHGVKPQASMGDLRIVE
jgi:hypothetical protein